MYGNEGEIAAEPSVTREDDMPRTLSARQLALLVILGVMCTGRSAAQAATAARDSTAVAPYRSRILGVFDAVTGLPIVDADVTNLISGVSTKTTRTGTVSLRFLPDGGGLVRIRKFGYQVQTMLVAISPADTAPITVVLQPVVRLPEVVTTGRSSSISPNLRGFEERRRTGGTGYFLTEEQRRKDDGKQLGNVLVGQVPGVKVVQSGHRMLLMRSQRCTNGGPPDVYLDGALLAHPSPPASSRGRPFQRGGSSTSAADATALQPMDLSEFEVSNLAGVEYYPDGATLPMQFHRTSRACGALLLWTRAR